MTKNNQPAQNTGQNRAFCRASVALYLKAIADQIAAGAIDAFDLQWAHDAEIPKPLGKLVFDAQYITTPTPDSRPRKLSEFQSAIPVDDQTEALKNAKACEDPDCDNCKQKS